MYSLIKARRWPIIYLHAQGTDLTWTIFPGHLFHFYPLQYWCLDICRKGDKSNINPNSQLITLKTACFLDDCLARKKSREENQSHLFAITRLSQYRAQNRIDPSVPGWQHVEFPLSLVCLFFSATVWHWLLILFYVVIVIGEFLSLISVTACSKY